jgi:plastocyanin
LLPLFILVALFAFAGCGGADEVAGDKKADSATTESSSTDTGSDDKMADDKASDDSGTDGEKQKDGSTLVEIDVKTGELKFEEDELTLPAGKVTLKSTNPDALEHNIAVKGNGVDEQGELVSNGDTSEVTVTLEKGKTYEFYCAPHEPAGMKGTIEVV